MKIGTMALSVFMQKVVEPICRNGLDDFEHVDMWILFEYPSGIGSDFVIVQMTHDIEQGGKTFKHRFVGLQAIADLLIHIVADSGEIVFGSSKVYTDNETDYQYQHEQPYGNQRQVDLSWLLEKWTLLEHVSTMAGLFLVCFINTLQVFVIKLKVLYPHRIYACLLIKILGKRNENQS